MFLEVGSRQGAAFRFPLGQGGLARAQKLARLSSQSLTHVVRYEFGQRVDIFNLLSVLNERNNALEVGSLFFFDNQLALLHQAFDRPLHGSRAVGDRVALSGQHGALSLVTAERLGQVILLFGEGSLVLVVALFPRVFLVAAQQVLVAMQQRRQTKKIRVVNASDPSTPVDLGDHVTLGVRESEFVAVIVAQVLEERTVHEHFAVVAKSRIVLPLVLVALASELGSFLRQAVAEFHEDLRMRFTLVFQNERHHAAVARQPTHLLSLR